MARFGPILEGPSGPQRGPQELKEDKAIPTLSLRIPRELDGRVIRNCREAIAAIREGKDRSGDVKKLQEEN